MLAHREFSAWIVSEGKPLDEYQVTVDTSSNKVSCWIPSEAGKHFSVYWRDAGSRFHSYAFVALDGFIVPVKFRREYGEGAGEGVRTGPATKRPFAFAEQAGTSASGGRAKGDAGMIALKIKRITIDGSRPANNLQRLPKSRGSQNRTLGHCVGFGRESSTYKQYPRTRRAKPYDGSDNGSYVTFVFRYRPKEFLLSQSIMPADDALGATPGSSSLMRPSPTLSLRIKNNSGPMVSVRQGSALQHRLDPGNVRIQSVTNFHTISTRRRDHYLGEGILTTNPDKTRT